MFRFASPEYFYLLFIIPCLILIYMGSQWIRKRRFRRLGDKSLINSLMMDFSSRKHLVKILLLSVALVMCVFALARPQWGTKQGSVSKAGIELSIMLDVSNSMLATDIKPNRLQRSKMLLSTLLEQLENHRVALGIFAGEAYPQVPLTHDITSAKMVLETVSPEMVTYQGTSTAAALRLATRVFSTNDKVGKAILLVTDGEDHEDGAMEVAEELKAMGIRLFVMGVGSTQGSPIPLKSGGFLLDEDNKAVKTALNEAACKEIASKADGLYIHIDESDQVQSVLLKEIEKLQHADNVVSFTEANEQFRAFALLALILLCIEFALSERKGGLFRRFIPFVLLFYTYSTASVWAQSPLWIETNKGINMFKKRDNEQAAKYFGRALKEDSSSAKAHFNVANALLASGKIDSALQHYRLAAHDKSDKYLASDAYHNMGFTYQKLAGDYKETPTLHDSLLRTAIQHYAEALRLTSTADDTRYNMVLCMKQLKDSQQQQQPQQQQKQEQEKQQQQPQKDSSQPQQPQEQQATPPQNQTKQLLNYARNAEQKTKEKLKQQPIRRYKIKNW